MSGIYIIEFDIYPGIYKIGKSRDIIQRYKSIKQDTILLGNVKLVYSKEFEDYSKAELDIHRLLKEYRVQENREFFKGDLNLFIKTIEELEQEDYKCKNIDNEDLVINLFSDDIKTKTDVLSLPYTNPEELQFKDLLIYAYLKLQCNNTSYVIMSLDDLCLKSRLSKPTILRAVNRLEDKGYISIKKMNKINRYDFISKENIYNIPSNLLTSQNLSVEDKAYLINILPYLTNNKLICSKTTAVKLLRLDYRTLKKYEEHLQSKDKSILTINKTNQRDPNNTQVLEERIIELNL